MLIECLVKRVGPTTVVLDTVKLLFLPVPFVSDEKGGVRQAKKDEPTTSVCDVDKAEFLEHFKRFPNTYREYVQGQAPPAGTAGPAIDMGGFSIVKTKSRGEEGYIVYDKKKRLYSGQGGEWTENQASMIPYPSEYEAWQWLKDNITEDEEHGDLQCPICKKECKNAQGLAAHMKACPGKTE